MADRIIGRPFSGDGQTRAFPLALKLLCQVGSPDTAVSGGLMNMNEPTFSSAQVAAAAGMTHGNFRAYIARDTTGWRPIGGMSAKVADKSGEGHLFSVCDALGYALAWALVCHGIDPQLAFRQGMLKFAHSGSDEMQPDRTSIFRKPGGVFDIEEFGATYFVLSKGSERGQFIAQKCLADPASLFFASDRDFVETVVAVDLVHLRGRVFASLGLDPRDYE